MFTIAVIVIAVAMLPQAIDTVVRGLRLLGRLFSSLRAALSALKPEPARQREELLTCVVFLVSLVATSSLLKHWRVTHLKGMIISFTVSLLVAGSSFLILEFLKWWLGSKPKKSTPEELGPDAQEMIERYRDKGECWDSERKEWRKASEFFDPSKIDSSKIKVEYDADGTPILS